MVTYDAAPYQHWVIEDLLPVDLAERVHEHFLVSGGAWTRRHHLYCRHKFTRTEGLPEPVEQALQLLEGERMRHWLAQLTGSGPLTADPARFGGGQHATHSTGRLGIHADFTHHPITGMRRALNLLVYLNPDPPRGGDLELWSADMRRCVKAIRPLFNRAVLFATSPTTYHGHPDPLPWTSAAYYTGIAARLSLAVYYYVPATPEDVHLRTTDYRPRPWEYHLRLRRFARRWVKGC